MLFMINPAVHIARNNTDSLLLNNSCNRINAAHTLCTIDSKRRATQTTRTVTHHTAPGHFTSQHSYVHESTTALFNTYYIKYENITR